MRPFVSSAILWAVILTLCSPVVNAQEKSATRDLEKFQGSWYNLSAESDGEQETGEDKSNLHIIIGNRCVTEVKGRVVQESILTLEPGEKFGRITFQMKTGPDQGKTWVGIYQVDENTLKWCGTWKGQSDNLPSGFTTEKGDHYFLRVMKLLKR